MHIRSEGAGWGRNFSAYVYDGQVIVKGRKDGSGVKEKHIVEKGQITESMERTKNSLVHTAFGRFRKIYKRGKLVEENFYSSDWQMVRKGLFHWRAMKGYIIKRYASGYSMAREIVCWKNGQVMYNLGKGNKNVVIFRKDGSPLAKIKLSAGISMWSGKYDCHISIGQVKNLRATFRDKWYYEVYDRKGYAVSWLKGTGNTPEDGCEKRKRLFFMLGIRVPEKVIKGDYDARFIMSYPNVTIRSEMLKKYGIDRVVYELQGESMDKNEEYELLQFPLPDSERNDSVMKVLKMRCPSTGIWYALRVHPQCSDIREAINWTYGLSFTEMQQNNTVEIVHAT